MLSQNIPPNYHLILCNESLFSKEESIELTESEIVGRIDFLPNKSQIKKPRCNSFAGPEIDKEQLSPH